MRSRESVLAVLELDLYIVGNDEGLVVLVTKSLGIMKIGLFSCTHDNQAADSKVIDRSGGSNSFVSVYLTCSQQLRRDDCRAQKIGQDDVGPQNQSDQRIFLRPPYQRSKAHILGR